MCSRRSARLFPSAPLREQSCLNALKRHLINIYVPVYDLFCFPVNFFIILFECCWVFFYPVPNKFSQTASHSGSMCELQIKTPQLILEGREWYKQTQQQLFPAQSTWTHSLFRSFLVCGYFLFYFLPTKPIWLSTYRHSLLPTDLSTYIRPYLTNFTYLPR